MHLSSLTAHSRRSHNYYLKHVCPTGIVDLENLYSWCHSVAKKWHNFQVWWPLERVVYAKVWQKIMYTWTVFMSIFSTVKARDIAQTVRYNTWRRKKEKWSSKIWKLLIHGALWIKFLVARDIWLPKFFNWIIKISTFKLKVYKNRTSLMLSQSEVTSMNFKIL